MIRVWKASDGCLCSVCFQISMSGKDKQRDGNTVEARQGQQVAQGSWGMSQMTQHAGKMGV